MDEPTNRQQQPRAGIDPSRSDPALPVARKRRWGRLIVWLLILLLVVGLAVRLLHKPAAQHGTGGGGRHHHGGTAMGDNGPQPVAVATARTGDMPVILTELGTVTSLANITVQSQISGYLLKVLFTEGQEVKKGDLLAQVDPRLYQATLTQYEGNLVRDQALLKQALADNARYTLLLSQHSIAAQTAQNQQYVVGQYQGAVKTDEGEIASAKQNLAYCDIVSPIDGRVGLRQVDQGNYITSNETNGLVVVTQLKPISVIFALPEAQIADVVAQMRDGKSLVVDAYDRTNTVKLSAGTVLTLDNTIDTSTGTVRVRATFPNEDEALFPNQFVNARLHLETLHNVVLVPNAALQTGPDGSFVYVVQPDHTVKTVPVKTGTVGGADVVIENGLKAGDVVVTDGTDRLKAGAKVTIPAETPAAATKGATPGAGHRHHRQGGNQSGDQGSDQGGHPGGGNG
ncbi:MdtA/MuxA family multidrug efflux RND transporter periplasmic adaptor subunit [Acetobacteraceae bacterium KSS8]|uniref:MdtA/MuxA family multidrug efflux RND transporter periplasmic adaptor subunit n=1 Tax=Endosaccharibacter trunci TaxID=2812733 RepID=A0ABT1W4D5_9PROT|nr:MdtA/MuxA family multidrug efflux RND transporter periplasmic adaptor subunit [Acetobacteraceae bacterium KSS8]